MQTLKSLKNIMVGLPVFCVEVIFIFVNKFPLSLTIKISLKKVVVTHNVNIFGGVLFITHCPKKYYRYISCRHCPKKLEKSPASSNIIFNFFLVASKCK